MAAIISTPPATLIIPHGFCLYAPVASLVLGEHFGVINSEGSEGGKKYGEFASDLYYIITVIPRYNQIK